MKKKVQFHFERAEIRSGATIEIPSESDLINSMKCPKCKTDLPDELVAKHFASKGGASGKGKAKARTSEQARAAVMARWNKRSKLTPAKGEKRK